MEKLTIFYLEYLEFLNINLDINNSNNKLKQIFKQDIDLIIKDINYLRKNGFIRYDNEEKEWKINGEYIEDYLWYEHPTILSPKTLKEPIEILIECLGH